MQLSSSNGTAMAVEYLQKSSEMLRRAFEIIVDVNEGGTQFDFVSCPRLSDEVDKVVNISKHIDKIVYQKK